MATSVLSRQLARQIAELGEKAVRRIVRLAQSEANAYFRMIVRAKNDPAVVTAVERYLLAARRAERHADPATRQMFADADAILRDRLSALSGPDIEMLRREIDHRRMAFITDPSELRAAFGRSPTRVARVSRDADLGAALMRQTFLGRVRSVVARGAGQWTNSDRLLLRGTRKIFKVLGGKWSDGWEPAFRYLRDHAANVADAVRRLRAADAALASAQMNGSAVAVAAARAEQRSSRQAMGGYASKVKGLLGEAYVPRWKDWRIQVEGYLELAEREARSLPGTWRAERVVGDLRIAGAEAWDEAILLINRSTDPPQAKLFLAAQFKIEKRISALKQVRNDALRETATETGLPRLAFTDGDGVPRTFVLTPMPAGKKVHRCVFNAEGGRVSGAEIDRLRATGIEVDQLTMDVSVAEFDAVTQAMLDAVADTVPRIDH